MVLDALPLSRHADASRLSPIPGLTRLPLTRGHTHHIMTFDPWPSVPGDLWSWPIHIQTVKARGHSIQKLRVETKGKTDWRTHTHTHSRLTDFFYRTTWVGRYQKDKPFWIFWNRDDGVAVVSARPYASHLHFAPDRSPCQHLISQVFTGRMFFLTPNQQCQSTEGKERQIDKASCITDLTNVIGKHNPNLDLWLDLLTSGLTPSSQGPTINYIPTDFDVNISSCCPFRPWIGIQPHGLHLVIQYGQTWYLSTQLCGGERTGWRLLWSTTLL